MSKQNVAAGLLMCKHEGGILHYFLVHPGGPYYKNKDEGVWSIPKGIPEAGEDDMLTVAKREFEEETGIAPSAPFHPLGSVRQKAGKVVHVWSFIGTWDASKKIKSNMFQLEWPPRSGKFQDFPEMDEAQWLTYEEAIRKINPAQIPLLDRAREIFKSTSLD